MKNLKIVSTTIIIITASLLVIYKLYPDIHTLSGIKLETSRDEIRSRASQIAENLHLSETGYDVQITYRKNNRLIKRVQEQYGLSEGNKILREEIPGYYWRVDWISPEAHSESTQDSGIYKHIRFDFDNQGYLIYLWVDIPDTLKTGSDTLKEIRSNTAGIIMNFTRYPGIANKIEKSDSIKTSSQMYVTGENGQKKTQTLSRTDYDFTWPVKLIHAGHEAEMKVKVKGNVISDLNLHYYDDLEQESADEPFRIFVNIVTLIGFFILVIYLTYKKSRAFEIRFSLGVKLAILMAILMAIEHYYQFSQTPGWEKIFLILIGPIFVGGSFIVVFAISESVGRDTWKEKFIPVDLLFRGHIFHSKLGLGFFQGTAIGSACFASLLFFTWIADKIHPLVMIIPGDNPIENFASANPILFILSHQIWTSIYLFSVFALLLISFLYQKFNRKALIIPLVAFLYPFSIDVLIQPILLGIVIQTLVFIPIVWSLFKYDSWVAFQAILIYTILAYIPLFGLEMNINTLTIIILSGVFGFLALWSVFSRDSITDFKEIEPALSKIISERQRMKQELDIAREVQMGLFPRNIPLFKGLDIAAECYPAQEVGGDYYDFIKTDALKLALAIGDVSGKGTKAAFYMTLVKGFLKALARYAFSPSEVLKQMNTLFFENTRHDAFISMIYAIFDMQRNELTMARSGHNPVFHYHKESNSITAIRGEGLALGLEKGELYNQLIEESHISLHAGDIFVLYTDGLTEAMNKTHEEYGDARIMDIILNNTDISADQLMMKLYNDVQKFSRGMPQHDDITLIVVKVL